jgi:hypothetical protein
MTGFAMWCSNDPMRCEGDGRSRFRSRMRLVVDDARRSISDIIEKSNEIGRGLFAVLR